MDLLILLQSILYYCVAVSGFLLAIPLESDLDGKCILYAKIYKVKRSYMMTWGDGSECRYVSSTGFFGIVFGLLAGVGFGYIANKSRKDKGIGYRMCMMVFVMMNAGLTLVSLVAACMLTIGFKTISNILGSQMCSPIITNGKLSNFVLLHSLSEVSAWIGTIINFVLTGISIVTLLRNRGRLQSRDTKNINLNTTRLPSIG